MNLLKKKKGIKIKEFILIEEEIRNSLNFILKDILNLTKLSEEERSKISSLGDFSKSFSWDIRDNIFNYSSFKKSLLYMTQNQEEIINNSKELILIIDKIIEILNSLKRLDSIEIMKFVNEKTNLNILLKEQNQKWFNISYLLGKEVKLDFDLLSSEIILENNLDNISKILKKFQEMNIVNEELKTSYINYLKAKLNSFSKGRDILTNPKYFKLWEFINIEFINILAKLPKKLNKERVENLIRHYDDILDVRNGKVNIYSNLNSNLNFSIKDFKTFENYLKNIEILEVPKSIEILQDKLGKVKKNTFGNGLKIYLNFLIKNNDLINYEINNNLFRFGPNSVDIKDIDAKNFEDIILKIKDIKDLSKFWIEFYNTLFNFKINDSINTSFVFFKNGIIKYLNSLNYFNDDDLKQLLRANDLNNLFKLMVEILEEKYTKPKK